MIYHDWPDDLPWFIYLYSKRLIFQMLNSQKVGEPSLSSRCSQARRQSFDPKDGYSTYAVSLAMGIHVLIYLF